MPDLYALANFKLYPRAVALGFGGMKSRISDSSESLASRKAQEADVRGTRRTLSSCMVFRYQQSIQANSALVNE